MKRFAFFILASGLFLLSSAAIARIGVIPVEGIVFTNPGVTASEQLSPDRVLVRTIGMSGVGTVDCGSNQDCLDTGLDGNNLGFLQDMRLTIDLASAGVKGLAWGEIVFPEANITLAGKVKFSGEIKGQMVCVGNSETPCKTLEVSIRLSTPLSDAEQKKLAGILALELIGTLTAGDGDLMPPSWTSLEGSGSLALIINDDQ